LPAGTTDGPFLDLYRRILPPLAARHRPEVVFVSAGYDAHHLDPLGGLGLSVAGLTEATRLLAQIADRHCDGRLVMALEGGYHLDALACGVASAFRVLADPAAEALDPLGAPEHEGPRLDALLEAVATLHGL